MTPPGNASHPLVGRDQELHQLRHVLTHGIATAVIQGSPGIGKSALVDEVVTSAARSGWSVMRAWGRELAADVPWAALTEALRGQSAASRDSGRQNHSDESWLARIDALSGQRPLLVIEDLHWCDPRSLAVLSRLVRDASTTSVGLVATTRSLPHREDVARLVSAVEGTPGGLVATLGPLDMLDSIVLATRLLGAAPGPRLRDELARGDGNPLLLTEMVSAWGRNGALVRGRAGRVEITDAGSSATLTETVARRMGLLPSDIRGVLTEAAVLGPRFPMADLVALTRRTAVELRPEIEHLMDAGLLKVDGDQLMFSHDLVRAAIYESTPVPVRLALHEQAAKALQAVDASPVVVAKHVLRSAGNHDPRGIDALARSAEQVLTQAPALSVALLEAALDRLPVLDDRRPVLAADRAAALDSAGRHQDAIRVCREQLQTARPEHAAQLWQVLIRAHVATASLTPELLAEAKESGQVSEEGLAELQSLAALVAALTTTSPDPAVAERRTVAWARLGRTFFADVEQAALLGKQAVAQARAFADLATEASALVVTSFGVRCQARLDEVAAIAERAMTCAMTSGSREGFAVFPHVLAAFAAADHDHHDQARLALADGERVAQELGEDNYLQALLVNGARLALRRGDWDDAEASLDAGQELAVQIHARPWVEDALIRGHLALQRQGTGAALAHLTSARSLADQGVPCAEIGGTPHLEMLIQERRGDIAGALDLARCLLADLETVEARLEAAAMAGDVARTAMTAGDRDLAGRAADWAESVSATNPQVRSARSWALLARGWHRRDPQLLTQATEEATLAGRLPDIATAAADSATVLAEAGDRTNARLHAHQALEALTRLRAETEIAWQRARWRDVGLTATARATRARPRTGWLSLTPTEERVARLVAEGRSNPEAAQLLVISRRTVQSHVANILTKLGVSSRRELVLAASQGRLEQLDTK